MNNPFGLQASSNTVANQAYLIENNPSQSLPPVWLNAPPATLEHGFGLLFEQAYYAWHRWYFIGKEVFDLTTQHTAQEICHCVCCCLNPCVLMMFCNPWMDGTARH